MARRRLEASKLELCGHAIREIDNNTMDM